MKHCVGTFFFLVCVCALAASACAAADTVRVATYDYIPLCSNDHQYQPGLFISLLEHIGGKENWHIQYVPGALTDSKNRLAQNSVDIMVAAQYTSDENTPYDFSRETVVSTWAMMYTRKETRVVETVLDIEGMRVGVVRDDPHNGVLRKMVKRLDRKCLFVEFKHPHDVIAALDRKWIDVGVVDRLYWFNKKKFSDIRQVSAVFSPVEFRFAVSQTDSSGIAAALDYHLHALKSDPQSVYYDLVRDAFYEPQPFALPHWIYWVGAIVAGVILVGIGMLWLLQQQVRSKTAALTQKNKELESEIAMRRVSERRYRELYESSRDGFVVIDLQFNIIECNTSFCEMLGYSARELMQMNHCDLTVERFLEA
ncbi:MAG: PAS domain S-box protein, partial [Chitinivibrionales bacterium]